MRVTLPKVNKAIAHLNVELIRGKGYFYFLSTVTRNQIGDSVMVYAITQMTVERWLYEAKFQIEEHKENHDNWLDLWLGTGE